MTFFALGPRGHERAIAFLAEMQMDVWDEQVSSAGPGLTSGVPSCVTLSPPGCALFLKMPLAQLHPLQLLLTLPGLWELPCPVPCQFFSLSAACS